MNSISSGQVFHCPYDSDKRRLIVREMKELLVLDLVRKCLVTRQIVQNNSYDRESLTGDRSKDYTSPVAMDHYGRKVPIHAHGTGNIDPYFHLITPYRRSSSTRSMPMRRLSAARLSVSAPRCSPT